MQKLSPLQLRPAAGSGVGFTTQVTGRIVLLCWLTSAASACWSVDSLKQESEHSGVTTGDSSDQTSEESGQTGDGGEPEQNPGDGGEPDKNLGDGSKSDQNLGDGHDLVVPSNPDLIPEARRVLNYLAEVYGNYVLAGMNGERGHAENVYQRTGRRPAVANIDLTGWSEKYSSTFNDNARNQMAQLDTWWREQGVIPTLSWHWGNPMYNGGNYADSKNRDIDLGNAVTPGTSEYENVMEDLNKHAEYMQALADANVPVLFRPLHEIDGDWFWWTDCNTPENTAELYRIVFNFFVHEKKYNNLIWVYNAGLKACGEGSGLDTVAFRQRFYPGDQYCDISGIDIYPLDYYGWGSNQTETYQVAFEVMSQVTPGKMLALSECQGALNPDLVAANGPKWLYFLPWWDDRDPIDYIERAYTSDIFLTADEMPWAQ